MLSFIRCWFAFFALSYKSILELSCIMITLILSHSLLMVRLRVQWSNDGNNLEFDLNKYRNETSLNSVDIPYRSQTCEWRKINCARFSAEMTVLVSSHDTIVRKHCYHRAKHLNYSLWTVWRAHRYILELWNATRLSFHSFEMMMASLEQCDDKFSMIMAWCVGR